MTSSASKTSLAATHEITDDVHSTADGANDSVTHKPATRWINRVQRISGMRIPLIWSTSELIADTRRVKVAIKPGWYFVHASRTSDHPDNSPVGCILTLILNDSSSQLLLDGSPVSRRIVFIDTAVNVLDLSLENQLDPASCLQITLSRVTARYAQKRMLKRMMRRAEPVQLKDSATHVEHLQTDLLRRNGHWPSTHDLYALYSQSLQRSFTPAPYDDWIASHEWKLQEYWQGQSQTCTSASIRLCIVLQNSADLAHWQQYLQDVQQNGAAAILKIQLIVDQTHVTEQSDQHRHEAQNVGQPSSGLQGPESCSDFVLLAGSGVIPGPQLLNAISCTLASNSGCQLLYTDHDGMTFDEGRCCPVIKPDWDPYLLRSGNYIGKLFVCSTTMYQRLGGLSGELIDSAHFDFLLRAARTLNRDTVKHLPGILYTQAINDPVAAHADRWFTCSPGDDEVKRNQNSVWALPIAAPRVEIIIPTRDHEPLLRQCIESIFSLTDYPDFHVTVVDNDSTDPAVALFHQSQACEARYEVLPYPGPFNYSAINNAAVAHTQSDVIVFLNNDTQIIQSDWLIQLVTASFQPRTGCVGARLVYDNGRIQHAGVVTGMKGIAGHAHRFANPEQPAYMHKLQCLHQVSAVTAACLAIRRDTFEQVGGLDEQDLTVAFNDVDLCLRVQQAGFDNLLLPEVTLIHHESISRGKDDSPEKAARFAAECQTMRERWSASLHRDPYWNPLLSLVDEQPMLDPALPPVA